MAPILSERVPEEEDWNQALDHAMQVDTPLGYKAVKSLVRAFEVKAQDPVALIKDAVGPENAQYVLRSASYDGALKVDFTPGSPLGKEFARLMTDSCRTRLQETFGVFFGFWNCCGGGVAKEEKKIRDLSTAKNQAAWQISIDC